MVLFAGKTERYMPERRRGLTRRYINPRCFTLPYLRLHYYVKDIAGAPYKIKPKDRSADSRYKAASDNCYAVQYNHDRVIIIK